MALCWLFLSALSICLTVGIEETACISLKVIARVVWLCYSDISHSICSCLKQRAGYPASDPGNETARAEATQLSSCRFLKLLRMLHSISAGPQCIEAPQRGGQFQLVLINFRGFCPPLWLLCIFLFWPSLATWGVSGQMKGFRGHFSEAFIDIPTWHLPHRNPGTG